jgi:hypothetical protein
MVRMVRGPGRGRGGRDDRATLCPQCGEPVTADVEHAVDVHGERWHAQCVLYEVRARARGDDGAAPDQPAGPTAS